MSQSSITQLRGDPLLECEFIPPLDYRDTWDTPWEQHLASHCAWQEAGGNRDGESCQWQHPGGIAFIERRRRAIAIDFPDRRLAA